MHFADMSYCLQGRGVAQKSGCVHVGQLTDTVIQINSVFAREQMFGMTNSAWGAKGVKNVERNWDRMVRIGDRQAVGCQTGSNLKKKKKGTLKLNHISPFSVTLLWSNCSINSL